MKVSHQSSSGTNQEPAGGAPADNPNTNSSGDQNDKVSYSSYTKVLGEKKKRDSEVKELREKLAEIEAEKKAEAENKLKEKEDWKSLVETRNKELDEERKKRESLEITLTDGIKLDAFLKNVKGKVDDVYLQLVNLEEITIDPETRQPDPASVQAAARAFEKKYERIIERPSGTRLPNDAPRGQGKSLTFDEWQNLPLKEKKAKLSQIVEAERDK